MDATGSPWFWSAGRVARPRVRLFCFPYAGGNGIAYRPLFQRLPPDVDAIGVQLPGRGARFREPLMITISPLLEDLYREITPLLDGTFAFFGHSMGAVLAFELCRMLRQRGGPAPACLVFSGRRAPQHTRPSKPARLMTQADLIDRLRRHGGTPEDVLAEPELLGLILPPLRADLQVLDSWQPAAEPPLDVPLTAIGGKEDNEAPIAEVEGWREHTCGDFAMHVLPGGHFFFQGQEEALARLIARALDKVLG